MRARDRVSLAPRRAPSCRRRRQDRRRLRPVRAGRASDPDLGRGHREGASRSRSRRPPRRADGHTAGPVARSARRQAGARHPRARAHSPREALARRSAERRGLAQAVAATPYLALWRRGETQDRQNIKNSSGNLKSRARLIDTALAEADPGTGPQVTRSSSRCRRSTSTSDDDPRIVDCVQAVLPSAPSHHDVSTRRDNRIASDVRRPARLRAVGCAAGLPGPLARYKTYATV